MSGNWFVLQSGEERGPYDRDALHRMLLENEIEGGTLLRPEGETQAMPLPLWETGLFERELEEVNPSPSCPFLCPDDRDRLPPHAFVCQACGRPILLSGKDLWLKYPLLWLVSQVRPLLACGIILVALPFALEKIYWPLIGAVILWFLSELTAFMLSPFRDHRVVAGGAGGGTSETLAETGRERENPHDSSS